MRSFFGDQELKDRIVAQVREHQRMDEIVQGTYWENGKGCAIGCVLHSRWHDEFEMRLGIPEALAYLDEYVFEWLPASDAKAWPLRFIEAVPVGVDLSRVATQFVIWILTDREGARQYAWPDGLAAMDRVAALHQRVLDGDAPLNDDWEEARKAAAAAVGAAAVGAAAVGAAAWAARAAAAGAAAAGAAAEGAAAWAARAAAAGAAAEGAAAEAERAEVRRQGDRLLSLLREAAHVPA